METTTKTKSKEELVDYINWFEIPVLNLDRAVNFYNQIYDIQMERTEANGYAMAFFPSEEGIGGALVMGPGCVPSETGSLVYLNAGEHLQEILSKVEMNGGRVIMGKTEIDEDAGHFALFIDSEGNKLALHSKNKSNPAPATATKSKTSAKTKSKSTGSTSAKKETSGKKTVGKKGKN